MKGSVPVYKLNVKYSLRRGEFVSGQTCFLAPYLLALYKYQNVIKNNITSSVLHIIVYLPKIE